MSRVALPILLLTVANVFMTFAWYWHLNYKHAWALWTAILISWLIAFVEYCFQVPANRLGAQEGLSTAQLKITQEIITLVVFAGFSVWFLGEKFRWNHAVGFGFIAVAGFFIFKKW